MAADPKPRIPLHVAIADRMGRYSGALRSALRAQARMELDPVMSEIDALLRQSCLLERLVFTQHVVNARVAPRVLIERLLTDNFLVAKSLHAAGYGMDDEQMIDMLTLRGREFQLDVASRPGLTERVCDHLISVGDPEVRLRVAANRRAAIAAPTLAWLMQKAAEDPTLAQALAHRIARPLLPAESDPAGTGSAVELVPLPARPSDAGSALETVPIQTRGRKSANPGSGRDTKIVSYS